MDNFFSFTGKFKKYAQRYFEVLFWITALLLLFFMNPGTEASSFCVFKFLHLGRCPGCGLGHSIHDALHLQFASSFRYHPMGIAAVFIILHRIKQLSFKLKPAIQ